MNTKKKQVVRLGAGAGFSGDRIEPALDLARHGDLDYLVFECLAERTIALAQQRKQRSPELGYDPMLSARLRAVLPIQRERSFKIVTNMGAANPAAAGRLAQKVARELGLSGLRIAVIEGDDVLTKVVGTDAHFLESGDLLSRISNDVIAANAYVGASAIRDALAAGADLVICGRVSDPALFLGPLIHTFDWSMTDWDRMAAGILAGHMLECAAQVSGGYFADPGRKDVPDLANLGFPIGEVSEDGTLVISILPDSGGCVTTATCKEQLIYEIHDPKAYIQPDVTADFSEVRIEELGKDRVRLVGARGAPRPADLKVSVAYQDGHAGEGQISYAGTGAAARARLAGQIVRERLQRSNPDVEALRIDLIGIDSLGPHPSAAFSTEPQEVRLRVAARAKSREHAEAVAAEVEALYTNGPAGGGGVTKSVKQVIAVQSILIPREQVETTMMMLEA